MTTAQHICLYFYSQCEAGSTACILAHVLFRLSCRLSKPEDSYQSENHTCARRHLQSQPSLYWEGRNRDEKNRALPVQACPQETPGHRGERNVSASKKKNPTRDASLCSATKSISHSLTSPPLWCHSFIRFPVAMATLLLGAVHSFTSVFLSLPLHPSPSPDPNEPSPLQLYSYTPNHTSIHPPLHYYTAKLV